jgi:hypothetical protein
MRDIHPTNENGQPGAKSVFAAVVCVDEVAQFWEQLLNLRFPYNSNSLQILLSVIHYLPLFADDWEIEPDLSLENMVCGLIDSCVAWTCPAGGSKQATTTNARALGFFNEMTQPLVQFDLPFALLCQFKEAAIQG